MDSTHNCITKTALIMALLCISKVYTQSATPTIEFANGQTQRFSTLGHAKAKDADFSMKYPKSWAAKEGERPNIVQNFVSEGGHGLEIVLIFTKRINDNSPLSKDDIRDILSIDGLMQRSLPKNANLISVKSTQIEAEPAGITEFTRVQQRAGMDLYFHTIVLSFIQKNTLIQIHYQTGGMASDSTNTEERFTAVRPLFSLMMNSIIFDSKWK